ncbi:hypothetical protein CFC21_086746 [Triticum aestivum]|uniref:F-box domain-containing protein n=3 Tax=Triticum TaxID=4564 RepID=A0A9R1B7D8_TRITD|nr:uncharacterized protein LOC123135913 [Triticum aestivum]KAF7082913.1 hypothetical protein CFC21_086746 [Triticum aestivum]VAI54184.1 unnamed protein product [Triticum turgidum subsp. durum]
MTPSLRRRPSSPASAPPLDDDDLLSEILLRLPPQPSSLPRASVVCKRWRGLVSDPGFLSRFRIHHRRNPPLLGCFVKTSDDLYFEPTLEPPNHVPRGRFSLQNLPSDSFLLLGCRHGLVLIFDWRKLQILVWDLANGIQQSTASPPGFHMVETLIHLQGAVLRAAAGVQHFQVCLAGLERGSQQNYARVIACVYSSETGSWGNLVSTAFPSVPYLHVDPTMVFMAKPGVLVGDFLYWALTGNFVRIIEFDLKRQSLAVIGIPVDMDPWRHYEYSVMRADDGGLGFLFLSDFSAQLWKRKTDCDGAAPWVLGRTIELDKLLSLNLHNERAPLRILGYAEENNVVFLSTVHGVFMIQLDPLQSNNVVFLSTVLGVSPLYYPFESIYTAGMGIAGGHDGAKLLHNA